MKLAITGTCNEKRTFYVHVWNLYEHLLGSAAAALRLAIGHPRPSRGFHFTRLLHEPTAKLAPDIANAEAETTARALHCRIIVHCSTQDFMVVPGAFLVHTRVGIVDAFAPTRPSTARNAYVAIFAPPSIASRMRPEAMVRPTTKSKSWW